MISIGTALRSLEDWEIRCAAVMRQRDEARSDTDRLRSETELLRKMLARAHAELITLPLDDAGVRLACEIEELLKTC